MERFRCTHATGGMHGGEHRRTVREEARQEYSKAAGNGAAAKMGSSSGGQAWMCNGAGDSSGDSWSAQSDGAAGRRSHSACWGRWIHRPRRGHRGAVGRREARRGWRPRGWAVRWAVWWDGGSCGDPIRRKAMTFSAKRRSHAPR